MSKVLDISFQRLDEIDFNSLQSDFGETNKVIRGFLTQILENYSELGPELTTTSVEATSTMREISQLSRSLNLLVSEDSDFTFQFSNTMRDVSLMSKSLKRLADLLERNPQAFLIGKPSSAKE